MELSARSRYASTTKKSVTRMYRASLRHWVRMDALSVNVICNGGEQSVHGWWRTGTATDGDSFAASFRSHLPLGAEAGAVTWGDIPKAVDLQEATQ